MLFVSKDVLATDIIQATSRVNATLLTHRNLYKTPNSDLLATDRSKVGVVCVFVWHGVVRLT